MAETTSAGPVGLSRQQEEDAFYHEAALNAAWTGTRLLIGVVASGLGALLFSFFYLRSLNSHGMWYPSGAHATKPSIGVGTTIMALVVVSALVNTAGLQQVKGGKRGAWMMAGTAALVLGVAAGAVQIWQLTSLSFQPGASGFASVFVGGAPIFVVLVFATMIWLEILLVRCRRIPEISFVEQPPTFTEAAEVQRFQASLSGFTLFWNFMAIVAIVLWVLYYLVH